MHTRPTKLTRTLLALTMLGTIFFSSQAIVLADVGKNIEDVFNQAVDGMFKSDTTGIVSLTDFKGGLQAPTKEGLDASLTQVGSAREFVVKVVNYLLSFLGLVAVVISIYGGVRIMTSVGESDGVEKGRKAITYAVVGIVVIMASYAIVNFALSAPGGAPAGQPSQIAVTTAATPFGAAPADGRNAQAARVYNLMAGTITGYYSYAQASLGIENINQTIDRLWNGTLFNSQSDASGALTQIENNYNQMADTIAAAAARSGALSTVSDMVQYQRLYVKKWLQDREVEIDILAKTPVQTGTVATPDLDETKISIGNDFLAYNCSADTPITVPSDTECISGRFGKDEYGSYFGKKYTDLITTLKNGEYNLESIKIAIGVSQMKAQLAKDFDSLMDANSKELKSIRSALTQPDGTLTITDEGRQIFDQLSGITSVGAVGTSSASGLDIFLQMKQNKASPVDSKNTLKDMAAKLGALYEILKNLQGVNVKLAANVREGNAPLIVTFKTQGSQDPSNLSITDENIFWDLDGDGSFGSTGKEQNSIACIEPKSAVATCIYTKPGTYHVAVKIKSASPDKSVVEGVQYMDIKVNPPRARFNIGLITSNNNIEQTVPITAYDKNGLVKIDRTNVQLAYSDIVKGLKFSAAGTVSGNISSSTGTAQSDLSKVTSDTIQHVRWTFGDGAQVDDSPSDNPNILVVDHPYARKGTYQVVLEVTGKDGIIDRKIFTINIGDISAIITVKPGYTVKVNSPITFASTVTSDGSRVISTEWSSTPDAEKFQSKDPQFSAAIDKPGTYTIMLKVQNENKNEATDKVEITVESNPPVAKFTAKPQSANKPDMILLDASQTYDPDGENTSILYQWKIDGEEHKDYKFLTGSDTEKTALVQFLTTGDKKITLTVEDANEKGKTTTATQTVSIKSLLDLDWSAASQSTGVLDSSGEATIALAIVSNNAKSYSWDYGDGEVEDGVFTTPQVQVKHIYKRAGIFTVTISVEDDSGNALKISRKISIGGGKSPIVSSQILINGAPAENNQIINVTRKDVITFDASTSKNSDGTAQNLIYSWDFGDGKKSTKPSATYTYKSLSPKDIGYYMAKITISDKTDPTKKAEDTYKIRVVALKPDMKTLLVVPLSADFKTPLRVQLKAVGANAPEGSIVSYRWWYVDPKDNTNELGAQITTTPETTITVGTRGSEGQQVSYVFQVELRDTENQIITAGDILGTENLPTLTVTNGANKPPVAKITVNKTSVNAGDTIMFSSASTDPDGKIVSYIWDLDGNGFQDDTPTDKSSVSKTYTTAAPNGIKVRLKVIDDSYAETISDPLTIYVISTTPALKSTSPTAPATPTSTSSTPSSATPSSPSSSNATPAFKLPSGANNMFAVPGTFEFAGSLASMLGFGILSHRSRRNKNTRDKNNQA